MSGCRWQVAYDLPFVPRKKARQGLHIPLFIFRLVFFPQSVPIRVFEMRRSWSSCLAARHVALAAWVRALRTAMYILSTRMLRGWKLSVRWVLLRSTETLATRSASSQRRTLPLRVVAYGIHLFIYLSIYITSRGDPILPTRRDVTKNEILSPLRNAFALGWAKHLL